MSLNDKLNKIEKTLSLRPDKENLVIFYDEESAIGYEPNTNDFIIICDYGEGEYEYTESNQSNREASEG